MTERGRRVPQKSKIDKIHPICSTFIFSSSSLEIFISTKGFLGSINQVEEAILIHLLSV